MWRNAGSFDPSRASFAAWIHGIARNRATDLIRRKARTGGADPLFEPEEGDHAKNFPRDFDMTEALAGLSPTHREVLILKYFKGLSQREIARQTGTPLGTVKSRTVAALRAMRKLVFPLKTEGAEGGVRQDRGAGDG